MDTRPKPNWWGRNWKWVVPVGCLTPLLCCGGFVTVILGVVFGAIKSSDVYTEAMKRARASQEVIALTGEPIEAGMFPTGNIAIHNLRGNADLTIPISGPKGHASLRAVAERNNGPWEFSKLEVVSNAGVRIDLRGPPKKDEQ